MKTDKQPSRQALPKTALPRIYRIDAEIASGKFPNSDDLAQLCETSTRNITKYCAGDYHAVAMLFPKRLKD